MSILLNFFIIFLILFFVLFFISIKRKEPRIIIVIIQSIIIAIILAAIFAFVAFIGFLFISEGVNVSAPINNEAELIIKNNSPDFYQSNPIYREGKVKILKREENGKFTDAQYLGIELPEQLQAKIYDPQFTLFIVDNHKKFSGIYRSEYSNQNVKVYNEEAWVWVVDWPSKKIIGTKFMKSTPPPEYKTYSYSDQDTWSLNRDIKEWIESLSEK